MNQSVVFEEKEVVSLAKFVAQLVREGVTFKVVRAVNSGSFIVELTGGF